MEANEKKAFLMELQRTPEMYVLISTCTKMPYVYCEPESFDDQVFIFHKQEDAVKAMEELKEKEIPVRVIKLINNQFLSFYSNLYLIGVNGLSVDYGTENVQNIQLSELVRRPDDSQLPEGKVKVENPELQLTTLYYMQELRRKPGLGSEQRFRDMEEELMAHFRKGTYIVPVKDNKNIPLMKMKNGDAFQPIFTDMPEFLKFCRDGQFKPAVVPYDKLRPVLLEQSKGMLVNPFGFHLVLKKTQL